MKFFSDGATVIAFDLRTCGFDQLPVINAGGTGWHTGDAAEARINVADPAFVHLRFAFESQLHQVNSAARRIHFLAPERIGGARGQAKAAVDALLHDFKRWRMMRVECTGEIRFFSLLRHATKFPYESARIQSVFRIELVLDCTHQRDAISGVSPCVNRMQFLRTAQDDESAAAGLQFRPQLFDRFR